MSAIHHLPSRAMFHAMLHVKHSVVAGAVLLAAWGPPAARAQEAAAVTDTAHVQGDENPYGSGAGVEILLTNHGFGLGGYLSRAVSPSTSLMAEVSLGAGKDEQELKFFRFGGSYIPRKAHYLLMMPLQVGLFQRLFREQIEDNFRPFVQVTAGPTFGWEYPYFKDLNGNGKYDSDERTYDAITALPKGTFRMGFGGTLALGAHFGQRTHITQGVRIGYTFNYFLEGIQLLEPEVQEAQRYFGTPAISLIFGRLF